MLGERVCRSTWLVTAWLSLLLGFALAVSQREGSAEFATASGINGDGGLTFAPDGDLEEGEVPLLDFPKTLNDFYKGTWTAINETSKPRNYRRSTGQVVFQLITRAHGREIKRVQVPSDEEEEGGVNMEPLIETNASKNGVSAMPPPLGLLPPGGNVSLIDAEGEDVEESKELILVEEVDMVQVDLVFRDGAYSTPRDLHTYLQGIYHKSSGKLSLWTVCTSPECGMYMFGGIKPSTKSPSPFDLAAGGEDVGLNRSVELDSGVSPDGFDAEDSPPAPFRSARARDQCIFRMDLLVEKREVQLEEGQPAAAVKLAGNVSSDNCNVAMHMNATAMNFEVYYSKAMHYTLMVTAAAFVQVLLLVRQIEYSTARSSAVKVSLLTIGQQAIMDSYLCLLHLTTGIVVEALFNAFATAAFFKFMIFSIFEMRYLLIIWKARRPQGFQEGWNAMRRELSMLYSRFYGCLLAGIILIYQMQQYSGALALLIYSFWLPQIVHNVQHDHRRPLLIRYIVGISATRLLIPLYALACPHNFLHAEPNYPLATGLVAWVAFQVLILIAQHQRGPRFFVPRQLRPTKYDYYRQIPMQPIQGEQENDCAICMMTVGSDNDSGPRVTTPCDHHFHEDCLKRWIEIKMECPVCRRPVPDIEED
mmetsp:Transcript_71804/g.149994  ORF Transcript_71804/g.149994 Transcript_71804/m.149994 type:complete len:647 (+) Transcript_71804:352-2292(+)